MQFRPMIAAIALIGIDSVHGRAQPSEARQSMERYAWDVLDTFWRRGSTVEKECVLGSLAYVESGRATSFFLEALRGNNPSLAARSANLLSPRRVIEAEPIMTARLASENEQYVSIQFMSRLREIHTKSVADAVLRFALKDRQPDTGVAFGVLQEAGTVSLPALETILRDGCDICRETAAFLLMKRNEEEVVIALKNAFSDPSAKGAYPRSNWVSSKRRSDRHATVGGGGESQRPGSKGLGHDRHLSIQCWAERLGANGMSQGPVTNSTPHRCEGVCRNGRRPPPHSGTNRSPRRPVPRSKSDSVRGGRKRPIEAYQSARIH